MQHRVDHHHCNTKVQRLYSAIDIQQAGLQIECCTAELVIVILHCWHLTTPTQATCKLQCTQKGRLHQVARWVLPKTAIQGDQLHPNASLTDLDRVIRTLNPGSNMPHMQTDHSAGPARPTGCHLTSQDSEATTHTDQNAGWILCTNFPDQVDGPMRLIPAACIG